MSVATSAFDIETFSTHLRGFLDTFDNHGIDRCSEATSKKIKSLATLITEADAERSKPKPDALKLRRSSHEIESIKKLILEQQDHLIEDCFTLYSHAHRASLPFIIGGAHLRETSSLAELKNFGVLSSGAPSLSHHIVPQVSNLTTGSIFCPKPWSLIRNDSFMFGAVQSNHSFYLAGPCNPADFFDEEHGHPTVLGREVAILSLSGYEQVADKKQMELCGPMFVCVDPDKRPATLPDLAIQVSKIKDDSLFKAFLSVSEE
jgi:hypothetical protein